MAMNRHIGRLVGIVALICALDSSLAMERKEKPMKQGILLVTFGTSVPRARVAFENIDRLVAQRFPTIERRWAYTASFIRRKLARQGEPIDSPLMALAKMREAGFTHVAVQSLHMATGAEYHDLAKTVAAFRSGPNAFEAITLGKPLLVRRIDLERVVEAVLKALPERGPNDAVVLMGHGNASGRGDMTFLAAESMFQKADPLAFLGTVEGQPSLDDVVAKIKAHGSKRALLVPLMSVAGDHACNDLAGDDEESWKSVITKLGVECIPVLKGVAEYDGVVHVWLDHLEDALKGLNFTDG
jgi:sirohydrochlorin cobaltochelatase